MQRRRFLQTLPPLVVCARLSAQAPKSVGLTLKETAGIRRFGFPVNTRVPFPKGVLTNPANARLLLDGKEVPVECTPESRWPDGSVHLRFHAQAPDGGE